MPSAELRNNSRISAGPDPLFSSKNCRLSLLCEPIPLLPARASDKTDLKWAWSAFIPPISQSRWVGWPKYPGILPAPSQNYKAERTLRILLSPEPQFLDDFEMSGGLKKKNNFHSYTPPQIGRAHV